MVSLHKNNLQIVMPWQCIHSALHCIGTALKISRTFTLYNCLQVQDSNVFTIQKCISFMYQCIVRYIVVHCRIGFSWAGSEYGLGMQASSNWQLDYSQLNHFSLLHHKMSFIPVSSLFVFLSLHNPCRIHTRLYHTHNQCWAGGRKTNCASIFSDSVPHTHFWAKKNFLQICQY